MSFQDKNKTLTSLTHSKHTDQETESQLPLKTMELTKILTSTMDSKQWETETIFRSVSKIFNLTFQMKMDTKELN